MSKIKNAYHDELEERRAAEDGMDAKDELVERLNDEAMRLLGQGIDRGCVDSSLAGSLASEAADFIERYTRIEPEAADRGVLPWKPYKHGETPLDFSFTYLCASENGRVFTRMLTAGLDDQEWKQVAWILCAKDLPKPAAIQSLRSEQGDAQ